MSRLLRIGSYLCLFAVLVLVANGCATLFKGSKDQVDFSSDPTGAKVYVNGALLGTTPVQLSLQSKHTYTIEFRKDGYETKTVQLTNSVGGGWIVLDILGGLIPVVIDAATGDWYSLDQEHVNGVLEAQQATKK